jgi:hypothetical protein
MIGATLLTAACSGGSSSPPAANPGTSSGNASANPTSSGNSPTSGSATAASSRGNVTQLVDQWAACMRSHGDLGQATPTIDRYDVIHITIPLSIPGGKGMTGKAAPAGLEPTARRT